MKTLWDKKSDNTKDCSHEVPDRSWFYRFTAEEDRELDQRLIPYDILVNIAQCRMLRSIGVYQEEGFSKVSRALEQAWALWEKGSFELGTEDEDVHSAIERFLTNKSGPDGARIHTGRSRNDQVLADMRLFMKDAITDITELWIGIAQRLEVLGKNYNGVLFAGMTHTQPAMPHSVDAWAAGYLDLLTSDLQALQHSYDLIDQSPLGSAAGYGVPYLRIDREFLAKELGFARVQEPVAASQLSRGRFEMQVVDALSYGALTFNRMASDVVLFMHPSFSLVTLSEDQVSGSSIMPQKRNPDAWELIRATYHDVQSARTNLSGITANLGSGYHRDLQIIKKGVMVALEQSQLLATAVAHALSGLEFDRKAAEKTLTPEIFATHQANKLVAEGMPFREAYHLVAMETRPAAGSKSKTGKTETSRTYNEFVKEPSPGTGTALSAALTNCYHHSGAPGSGIPALLSDRLILSQKWKEQQKEKMKQRKQYLVPKSDR